MNQLGLTPIDFKEGDYAAIAQKLDQMETQATSDLQKAQVGYFRADFEAIFSASSSREKQTTKQNKQGHLQGKINLLS